MSNADFYPAYLTCYVKQRLQKVLASAGVGSRRGAEQLIVQGEVSVNGLVATVGQSVDPDVDDIVVAGRSVLAPRPFAYLALHKPRGYVTSLRSTHGERTVMDLVESDTRLYPVGRLDKETSGLLLLTNDGDWANLIAHPRYQVEKEYNVVVRGFPGESTLGRLSAGVSLDDDTVTSPAIVEEIDRGQFGAVLRVIVIEGRKRQIRYMMEAVGHPVIDLRRVRIGPIELGLLPESKVRCLRDYEVDKIRKHDEPRPS